VPLINCVLIGLCLALVSPHKLRWHTLPCLTGSWPKFLRSAYPWGGCRPCSFTGSSHAPSWNKFLPTISSLFFKVLSYNWLRIHIFIIRLIGLSQEVHWNKWNAFLPLSHNQSAGCKEQSAIDIWAIYIFVFVPELNASQDEPKGYDPWAKRVIKSNYLVMGNALYTSPHPCPSLNQSYHTLQACQRDDPTGMTSWQAVTH